MMTPGPWKLDEMTGGHHPRVEGPDGKLIACVGNMEPWPEAIGEWIANARAIAALPELVEALRQGSAWFREYAESHTRKGDADKAKRNSERADFLDAALAKMEGTK